MSPRVLRTADAAAYIGLATATLEKMRLAGTGPRYVRLTARSVGYDVTDLVAWVESRKMLSTSARPA